MQYKKAEINQNCCKKIFEFAAKFEKAREK